MCIRCSDFDILRLMYSISFLWATLIYPCVAKDILSFAIPKSLDAFEDKHTGLPKSRLILLT